MKLFINEESKNFAECIDSDDCKTLVNKVHDKIDIQIDCSERETLFDVCFTLDELKAIIEFADKSKNDIATKRLGDLQHTCK